MSRALLAALLALWVALLAPPAAAQAPYPWLDPAAEVPAPAARPRDDAGCARALLDALATLLPTRALRAEVAAIAVLETGWCRSPAVTLHNFGGSKAKRDIVERYRREHGRSMRWFRARGHINSGDAPWVFYAVWDSAVDYWRDWLRRHLGTAPGVRPLAGIYAETAARFWRRSRTWIDALIDAGYRGRVTAGDPARRAAAIRGHHSIVARILRLAPGGTTP